MSQPCSDTGDRITPVLDLRLGLRVQAIRVDYAPGGHTPGTHRHPPGAYVYVIDGADSMGLENEPPRVLHAGDTFYEPPGALHSVSSNASQTQPVCLVAFLVVAAGQQAAVAG